MLMPESCAVAVLSDLKRLWIFLQSDTAHLMFISLAMLRALIYLLLKDPRPEARELACAIVAAAAILLTIAIQEIHPLARSQSVAMCANTQTNMAAKERPAAPGG